MVKALQQRLNKHCLLQLSVKCEHKASSAAASTLTVVATDWKVLAIVQLCVGVEVWPLPQLSPPTAQGLLGSNLLCPRL